MPSFPYAFIPSFIRSLNPSPFHLFIHSFIHSFIPFPSLPFHFISFHFIHCIIHCIFLSLQASSHFFQVTRNPPSFLPPIVMSLFRNSRPGAYLALSGIWLSRQDTHPNKCVGKALSSRGCGGLLLHTNCAG